MGSLRGPRWLKTLRGFTGLGGLSWVASVLADRTPAPPEDLTLADVLPPGARHVSIQGQPVALRDMGEGEPAVLLLHGFAEHLDTWRPVQERLARRHRTVALDLWGFAASARPPHAKPADWVDEVVGLMDELGLGQAVLVGHSLGGRASLMTARAHPERVAGVVLADADWGQAPHGYVIVWLLAHSPALPWVLGRFRAGPRHLQHLARQIITPNHDLTPALQEALLRPLRVQDHAACWRSLGQAPPLRDVRGLARSVSCPALVLWGADDPVVPLWAGRKLARQLGCEIQVFDRCGHFLPEEYPEETAESIEGFLEGLPGGK